MDLTIFSMVGLGFFIGLRHAFDADHIVAVSTIVSQTKKLSTSSFIGMIWGIGHTTSLLVAGLLILFFKITIPPQLSSILEFCVGVMLLILGIDVFLKMQANRTNIHGHKRQGLGIFGKLGNYFPYFHSHKNSGISHSHKYTKKAFLIGIVHGLAGSAALMLLVLATATSFFQGIAYILAFGIGLIVSMAAISTVIGLPFSIGVKLGKVRNIAVFMAGCLSVILGLIIILENALTLF